MAKTIDPLTLAQFMTQPGAAELIEAFSDIPPGPLRESIVQMAQATRLTYLGTAAQTPEAARPPLLDTPPPSPTAFGAAQAAVARALTGPRRGAPRTDDPAVKAVELLLEGVPVHKVAEALALPFSAVMAARKAAQRGGIKFPAIPRKKGRKDGRELAFHTTLDGLSPSAIMAISRAAEARGIDAEGYMARRRLIVQMATEGRHIAAIMEASRESKGTIQQWISLARSAGHKIPYMTDQPSQGFTNIAPPQPTAEVIDLKPHRKPNDEHRGRFITDLEEMSGGGGGIQKGSELMGVSVERFLELRRQALALFLAGRTVNAVARELRITPKQATNWRARAQRAGKLDLVRPSPRMQQH